jgi:1-acyl-sn-glycerol-3-phosphate acyltransferase
MLARLTDLLYRCLYFPLGMLVVFTHGYRVSGRQHIPSAGPVLLIGNHQSYLDIPLMGLACPRRIWFLAKKPLFNNAVLRWIMDLFGTVSVDNEGFSRAGLEGILQELRKGHAVLVYPEGERTWDGQLAPLKPGITLLVRRGRCPIVPIGIAGAFDAWPRTRRSMSFAPPFLGWRRERIGVYVGKPIDGAALAEREREEILQQLQQALADAVKEAEGLRGGPKRLITPLPPDAGAACGSPCTSRR